MKKTHTSSISRQDELMQKSGLDAQYKHGTLILSLAMHYGRVQASVNKGFARQFGTEADPFEWLVQQYLESDTK